MASNKSTFNSHQSLVNVILLPLLALGILAGFAGPVSGATIIGTVSLPSGQTAPAGGIDIDINADDDNSDGGNGSTSVTIPENSSSITYTMTVPDDAAVSWRVWYSYWGSDYLRIGYYATTGTTWDSSAATTLPGGQDHAGIDMALLTGKTIIGTVSLSSGQTAPTGGMDVDIYADDHNGVGYWSFDYVTIPEGSSSVAFTMQVVDDGAASWVVSYDCYASDYLQNGYYATDGTTWDYSGATLLSGGQDHAGIDMTLLTGNTITGIVSLPSGQTAPAGGINMTIRADNDYYVGGSGYSSWVTIPEGSSSIAYTMTVPDDAAASWRVWYSYWGSDYLQDGYYATGGTTWDYNGASLLSSGQDHAGIDMTLLTINTITGIVSLPSGEIAPVGGIYVDISADDDNGGGTPGYSSVAIPEGSSSATYSMIVPEDAAASWRVSYSYWGSDYLQNGYYATGGTTWEDSAATLLPGGQDYSGIDLSLLTGNTIIGTVSLPSRQTAPAGGIHVNIRANDDNNDGGYGYSSITIPEGSSSIAYTIRVRDDATASWRISYDYYGHDYLQWGYYASGGTTWKYSDTTSLAGGQDYNGIDLSLLVVPTITIQGSACLPVGTIANDHQFIDITIYDAENNMYWSSDWNYMFGVGENCLTYQVEVPQGSSDTWQVGYDVYDSNFVQGYYSSSGTVKKYSEATPLSAAQDHNGIDMTILRAGGNFPWNMFLPAIIGRTTH